MPELIREAYADAVKDVIDETGLPVENFPNVCAYAPDEVLAEEYLPDANF